VPCCRQETESICSALRKRGAEPLPYPTYIREACDDTASWERFAELAAAGGWCLFTSETEVCVFMDALLHHRIDIRKLHNLKIAAVGLSTDVALRQRNILADAFLSTLPQELWPRDFIEDSSSIPKNLIVFSGEISLELAEWTEVLSVKLFRLKPSVWESHWIQELRSQPPDFILFHQAADVDGFIDVMGREAARNLASQSKVIAVDERVKAAACRHGLEVCKNEESLFDLGTTDIHG
jgi:uroporphyrinogen-III synthase